MSHTTRKAFLEDAYLTACEGRVVAHTEQGGIILDTTNFYATSGGQPGDSGFLEMENGEQIIIATTVNGADKNEVVLVPAEGESLPPVGSTVISHIDWDR